MSVSDNLRISALEAELDISEGWSVFATTVESGDDDSVDWALDIRALRGGTVSLIASREQFRKLSQAIFGAVDG